MNYQPLFPDKDCYLNNNTKICLVMDDFIYTFDYRHYIHWRMSDDNDFNNLILMNLII